MSRERRNFSKSGFYHIVVTGVNKEPVFYDSFDRKFCVSLIKRCSAADNIEIHAYCLMENHIHLLIKDVEAGISAFMQHFLTSYVRYFNAKTDRIGHLIQNRYRSEIVCDEAYYKKVLRYILQNPVKAGIAKIDGYAWSSYGEFFKTEPFVKTDFIRSYFKNENQMFSFLKEDNDDECMDLQLLRSEKIILNQLKVREILMDYSVEDLKRMPLWEKQYYFSKMNKSGIPIRIIARLTGFNPSYVQRTIKRKLV